MALRLFLGFKVDAVHQFVLQLQENMRLFLDLEFEPEEFHIYIYTKSYFYTKLFAGRLQYLSVKRGEYTKAHLSMQVKYHSNLSKNIPKIPKQEALGPV